MNVIRVSVARLRFRGRRAVSGDRSVDGHDRKSRDGLARIVAGPEGMPVPFRIPYLEHRAEPIVVGIESGNHEVVHDGGSGVGIPDPIRVDQHNSRIGPLTQIVVDTLPAEIPIGLVVRARTAVVVSDLGVHRVRHGHRRASGQTRGPHLGCQNILILIEPPQRQCALRSRRAAVVRLSLDVVGETVDAVKSGPRWRRERHRKARPLRLHLRTKFCHRRTSCILRSKAGSTGGRHTPGCSSSPNRTPRDWDLGVPQRLARESM